SRLRGRIVALASIAGHTDDRADPDDPPMPLAEHPFKAGTGETKGGSQIDVKNGVPFLVLHAHEEIVPGHAGIVDEDIDASHRGFSGGNKRLRRCFMSKIARKNMNVGFEFGSERGERLVAGAR